MKLETKKPLTTETQRHREKHENQSLFFKDFLCAGMKWNPKDFSAACEHPARIRLGRKS
jgi:hypothetical protein